MRCAAFISYSHTNEREASRLRGALESFRLPKDIAAPAGVRCFIQPAIQDLPGDDFDLDFDDGHVEPAVMPLHGAEVGFRLGTNRYRHAGQAIDNRRNLRFEFRNGGWVNR